MSKNATIAEKNDQDTKDYCHCQVDLTTVPIAAEYNLPLYNRDLVTPFPYYQNYFGNAMDAYYVQMMVPYYGGYEFMNMEQMPTLNQLATSFNTEDVLSHHGTNKKRKQSHNLDDSEFSLKDKKSNSKNKSDVRLRTQEKRLQDHNLMYESKETYNPKTKRTSRVLVCLHEGCGKEFKKTRNLIIHSRVHTKIRPHVCQYCNKGFTQQCNLKKHIDLHLNGTFKSEPLKA